MCTCVCSAALYSKTLALRTTASKPAYWLLMDSCETILLDADGFLWDDPIGCCWTLMRRADWLLIDSKRKSLLAVPFPLHDCLLPGFSGRPCFVRMLQSHHWMMLHLSENSRFIYDSFVDVWISWFALQTRTNETWGLEMTGVMLTHFRGAVWKISPCLDVSCTVCLTVCPVYCMCSCLGWA